VASNGSGEEPTAGTGAAGAPVRRRRRSGSSEQSVRLDAPSRAELRRRRRHLGSGRRPRRETTPAERAGIYAVAGVAGVVAASAGAHPTGTVVVDEVLVGAGAAAVVLAASRAQRWTWLLLAGLGTMMAGEAFWQLVAALGLLAAFVAAFLPRVRWIGAVAAGLGIQGLLRSDVDAFHGASVLVGLVAVVPVLVSAWEVAPRATRRRATRVGIGVGAVVAVATLLAGVSLLLARSDLEAAAGSAQEGFDALADGRPADASGELAAAAAGFDSGASLASAWWAWPGRVVPVVAQQVRGVDELASAGAVVTAQAAAAAGEADVTELRYEDGRLDLDLVAATQQPLADTVVALEEATSRVDAARSPWLLGPVAAQVDRLGDDIAGALPSARLAAQAVEEAPALLGGEGTRRYLVLFTTPAESRGLGGFVGNWALLEATDGAVDMVDSGRIGDLNDLPGRDERTITGPDDYVGRYGRFRPAYWLQDTTLSPDLPTVATVWRELWPQLRGEELDGVIVIDPIGLAALLELTGPIRVDGWDEPLTADNAAEVLLSEQYVEIADREARADLLDEASRVAFEELTTGTLPSPREVSGALSAAVASGRIAMWTFDESEQALLRRMGVDRSFPRTDGTDLLAVITQNSAQNKIDVFLRREVDYAVSFDPATGAVSSTATITLRNDAPADGLPDAVIGSNDQGLPRGTNRTWVSVYSPLALREARLDGSRVGVEYGRELAGAEGPGYGVYGGFFTIPPGGSITLELDLEGTVAPGAYRLRLPVQPLVNPDEVHLDVSLPPGWRFAPSERVGVSPDGRRATLDVARFARPLDVVLPVVEG